MKIFIELLKSPTIGPIRSAIPSKAIKNIKVKKTKCQYGILV